MRGSLCHATAGLLIITKGTRNHQLQITHKCKSTFTLDSRGMVDAYKSPHTVISG